MVRGTEEMMQPCLTHLHIISLVQAAGAAHAGERHSSERRPGLGVSSERDHKGPCAVEGEGDSSSGQSTGTAESEELAQKFGAE